MTGGGGLAAAAPFSTSQPLTAKRLAPWITPGHGSRDVPDSKFYYPAGTGTG